MTGRAIFVDSRSSPALSQRLTTSDALALVETQSVTHEVTGLPPATRYLR